MAEQMHLMAEEDKGVFEGMVAKYDATELLEAFSNASVRLTEATTSPAPGVFDLWYMQYGVLYMELRNRLEGGAR